MNLAYSQGGLKLEINIPLQHISAKSKGGLIIEGGVISSEYGNVKNKIGEEVCVCVGGGGRRKEEKGRMGGEKEGRGNGEGREDKKERKGHGRWGERRKKGKGKENFNV